MGDWLAGGTLTRKSTLEVTAVKGFERGAVVWVGKTEVCPSNSLWRGPKRHGVSSRLSRTHDYVAPA